jgi:hypothetical protein
MPLAHAVQYPGSPTVRFTDGTAQEAASES